MPTRHTLAPWLLSSFVLSCTTGGNEAQDDDRSGPQAAAQTQPAPQAAGEHPKRLYLPGDTSGFRVDMSQPEHYDSSVTFGPPQDEGQRLLSRGACPPDMVHVASMFCIDRYEISLVEQREGLPLSPHYPPTHELAAPVFRFWTRKAPLEGLRLARLFPLPEPPDFQITQKVSTRARSLPDRIPAGYLRRQDVELACKNAGKRLCRREEWVQACRGEAQTRFPYGDEYRQGACNVNRKHHPASLLHGNSSQFHNDPRLGLTEDEDGPLLRPTGATPECVSHWGDDVIYDMVGNLDEWIADPSGTFLGGFFSRGTKMGCEASIESHSPGYWDYSLGGRCCADPE